MSSWIVCRLGLRLLAFSMLHNVSPVRAALPLHRSAASALSCLSVCTALYLLPFPPFLPGQCPACTFLAVIPGAHRLSPAPVPSFPQRPTPSSLYSPPSPCPLPTIPSRANAQQPKLFVGMILILIFAEALALYGLIVGIILASKAGQSGTAPPAAA